LKNAGTDVGMSATPDIGIDWDYVDQSFDSDDFELIEDEEE